LKVSYEGAFETPDAGYLNCPYSVEDINSGKVPWLRHNRNFFGIFAGASLESFKSDIERWGGSVTIPDTDELSHVNKCGECGHFLSYERGMVFAPCELTGLATISRHHAMEACMHFKQKKVFLRK